MSKLMTVAEDRFFTVLMDTFGKTSVRFRALEKMYTDMREQLITAPASTKTIYHNCYEGGYLDHVLNVYDNTMAMVKLYHSQVQANSFSIEEATFAALHHDLGKLGDGVEPNYIKNTNDFEIEMGNLYRTNPKCPLDYYDRSIYVLQKYNVTITPNEQLAIRLADGMYDKANHNYFYNSHRFPSDLPFLIHWADHMSTIVEKGIIKRNV